jgi:hypothetical protein
MGLRITENYFAIPIHQGAFSRVSVKALQPVHVAARDGVLIPAAYYAYFHQGPSYLPISIFVSACVVEVRSDELLIPDSALAAIQPKMRRETRDS